MVYEWVVYLTCMNNLFDALYSLVSPIQKNRNKVSEENPLKTV